MPKIATYGGQQVQTQVVRGARASSVPSGAFGGDIARGIGQVGQAFEEIGKQQAEMQKRLATTEAEDALVKFEREKNKLFFDPEAGYFNTQGRDAFDAAGTANTSLQKLQQQYADNLTNDAARQLFSKAAAAHVTRGTQDIMQHASKGMKAWEVATIEAQVENTVENAALYWNDPERLGVQRALGRQAVVDAAGMQGIDGEALNERLQTYESSFTRTAIEAATQKSVAQGKKLLDQFGNRLEGPDKLKMDKLIQDKLKVENTKYIASQAVVRAGGIVDRYDSRSDIIAEVNKISDPELRDKTMRESMYQFGLRKQAESEDRVSAFEAAENFIANGGSAEQFQMNEPDAWEKMSPKQRANINAGKGVTTDWNTFNELMLLPEKELAKIDPSEYVNQLAAGERSKLLTAVRSAQNKGSESDKVESQAGRTRTQETNFAVTQIFGKKPSGGYNEEKSQQINAFYSTLTAEQNAREAALGRKLDSQEYTDLLAGFTRKTVKERSFFGVPVPDSKLDFTDVPAEEVPSLSAELRRQGIAVTTDNLIRLYEQVK